MYKNFILWLRVALMSKTDFGQTFFWVWGSILNKGRLFYKNKVQFIVGYNLHLFK